MKDLVKYIKEAEEKTTETGVGGEVDSAKKPEGKFEVPGFKGYQSDQEIDWESIYYYVLRGKTEQEKYEKDIEKAFGLLHKGKFGKQSIVKTVVEHTPQRALVDEERRFVYNKSNKSIVNVEDPKEYYNAQEFYEDTTLWGLIVVDDDREHYRSNNSASSNSKNNYNYNY